MAKNLTYYANEVKFQTLKTGRKVQAGVTSAFLKLAMGGGAASVATDIAPALGSGAANAGLTAGQIALSSTAGLVSIGAGAGISAYINHLEHKHHESQLTERFREELGSFRGKDFGSIGVEDLKEVAQDNPAFKQELRRNDVTRNLKNTAAVIGTVVAFAAVFAAVTMFPPLLAGGVIAQGAFAIGSAIAGAGIMHATRKAVVNAGKKLFHIDKPTTLDAIKDLGKDDKVITHAQVLGVFEKSNPALSQDIESTFGTKFDDLDKTQRMAAVEKYGAALNLGDITYKLNEGDIRPQELAFTVAGQSSGYIPPESLANRIKANAQQQLDQVQNKIADVTYTVKEKMQDWQQDREITRLANAVEKSVIEGKDLPKEALDIAPAKFWQDLVAQQREQATKAPAQPARA
ncbi:MAG: hypothetical protein FJX23_02935 [Alphaproteobacteria bacterium]|nr:hypothetical protein [Alphaproteobacteria bacterium]